MATFTLLTDHPGPTFTDEKEVNRAVWEQIIARKRRAPEQMDKFGRYIHELRDAHGWTRLELGQRANLNPVAIGLLEAGCALVEEELTEQLMRGLVAAFGIQRLIFYPTEALAQALNADPGR